MADRDLLQAFQAACAFIDAHVADPDITPKMVETYAEFVRWRGIVEAAAGERAALAADERAEGAEPVAQDWQGEEWERLAWHLCAEENGDGACNELVWEGGPIPEPWGDRWMKYEPEAKRMIDLVRKFAAPAPKRQPLTTPQRVALGMVLHHYGDDPRVQCLRSLIDDIKED